MVRLLFLPAGIALVVGLGAAQLPQDAPPQLDHAPLGLQAMLSVPTAASDVKWDAPFQTYSFAAGDVVAVKQKIEAGDPNTVAAYDVLVQSARGLAPPWWSVMNKTLVLPHISKANYVSIGIYNHPCNKLPKGCKPYPNGHLLPPGKCDNATGLPWEPCDGIRNPAAIAEGDAPSAAAMNAAAGNLALAAFFCQEAEGECRAWAASAAAVLRAWFIDNATRMEPNLYYGQIMPSATPPHKGHGGFIEWTHLPALLDKVTLLRHAYPEVWTDGDSAGLQGWLAQFLSYVGGHAASGERNMTNNHGSWFDNTWQGVALAAGRRDIALVAAKEVKTRRIDTQILGDGREWIELERTNPAGYCVYNLLALTENACQAANANLTDVFAHVNPKGAGIRKAVEYLVPFALGTQAWPYKQIDEPDWSDLFAVLRRTSVALKLPEMERDACLILKRAEQRGQAQEARRGQPAVAMSGAARHQGAGVGAERRCPWCVGSGTPSYTKDTINLLYPPAFHVTC